MERHLQFLNLAKYRPDAQVKVAKYRRWAFCFKANRSAEYAQRKKGILKKVVNGMPPLRMEDVSETRVDMVWPRGVGFKSAERIAQMAKVLNAEFSLRRPPKGIKDKKDDEKEKEKEDKDSIAKKDEKDEKDEKNTPKKRKKKKKTSKCTPEKRKTSKGAPAEKDEKDSPKKAKQDTNIVMSTQKQCCNTLDHYFIRAEKPADELSSQLVSASHALSSTCGH